MTEEQQDVIDAVVESDSSDKIIVVNAVAGAGKTTTAVGIAKAVNPDNGFYTAFNKAIVKDSSSKFGDILEAKTLHSLAYKYIKPSKAPKELSYDMINENITYTEKRLIINYLDDFYRSSAINFEEYFSNKNIDSYIEDLVMRYANKMYSGKIPCSFNYLLKCLHLMLHEGSINPSFDLFIFDEFQDVTPVGLEIFKLLDCKKKVALGDTHQNIYQFLNTVNGFELLDNTNKLYLTKSFRCNEEVANDVEEYGKINLNSNFKFRGNESLNDVNFDRNNKVFLSRSNSNLITRMYDLTKLGYTFSLVKTLDEIFELPLAIVCCAANKPVYSPKFKFLEIERNKWQSSNSGLSYINYLLTLDIREVTIAVKTLKNLYKKNINIFDLKESLKKVKPNKDIVLSTVHSYKGLEKNIAVLESNLNNMEFTNEEEEIQNNNLYYVALSRAKHKIIRM